jgi:hypothetical protein
MLSMLHKNMIYSVLSVAGTIKGLNGCYWRLAVGPGKLKIRMSEVWRELYFE